MTDVSESEATPRNFTVTLKGGCGTIEVNASQFSDEVYEAVFLAGLESIINKQGMSKLLPGITKLEGEEKEQRTQEVRETAEKTVQAMYAGSIKGAVKTKKASSAVETEALRLAKNMAKDIIRDNGQKVGAYSAKEHTVFAKAVLERNRASLIATAEKNLKERSEGAKALTMPTLKEVFGAKADSEEVKAKPKVTPKRKGKDEVKAPLSAAQAGKVTPRQKPLSQHLTH
jgi:hypothetical protein